MHIPNYANKIAEKYIIGRNCTLSVYSWMASKGYQTDFEPVQHLGIRVWDNEKNKRVVDKITTSQKMMKEYINHWKNQFNLEVKL